MYYLSNINEIIDKIQNCTELIIWGFGEIGITLCDQLQLRGHQISAFCDNNIKKHGIQYNNIKVLPFDKVKSLYQNAVYIVSSQGHYEDIKKQILNSYKINSRVTILRYIEYLDDNVYYGNEKKILITGVGLQNSGSQSMAFIVVDEMKKRCPDCDIVMWTWGNEFYSNINKSQYTFTILPNPDIHTRMWLSGKEFREITNISMVDIEYSNKLNILLKNTVMIIDVSGYALGSNWNYQVWKSFVLQASIAENYGIDYYIMPQSFGPMDFKYDDMEFIHYMAKNYLSKAKCIYAREKQGYDNLVQVLGLKNVVLSQDMVLLNKGYKLSTVYKEMPERFTYLHIKKGNNVAVIPHSGLFEYGNKELIIEFYKSCIMACFVCGKQVYLIAHAEMDLILCKELKELYPETIIVDNKMSCFDYAEMIKNFDYIVASRYHAIVHALKEGIPCITLGWADKYRELMNLFFLEKYTNSVFDLDKYSKEKIKTEVIQMDIEYKTLSNQTLERTQQLQSHNIFDIMGAGDGKFKRIYSRTK